MIKKIIALIAIMVFYPVFFGLCTVLISGIATEWSGFVFWPPFSYGAKVGVWAGLITIIILVPILWLLSRSKWWLSRSRRYYVKKN